jgi:maleylacetate reductase
MKAFTYNALPGRVVFGAGTLQKAGEELERLGAQRALVLSTPEQRKQAEDLARRLGDRAVGIYDQAVMHTPIESVRAARELAKKLDADCAVAIGGGSTVGLGKGIALESGLPILAIPTTYAGSEMTPILGITENGVKKTQRDLRMLPKVVIYDPLLTLTLPVAFSATSAMNAIAHCVEALYAQDANPVISLQAEEGIRALAQGLPQVVKHANDLDARSQMLYGAWLAGAALGAVGMALHHKLCHTLGGSFNLPHAETHTVVLPHAVAYNTEAAPEAMARVERALGANNAAQGLYDLAKSAGTPISLKEIGMPADGLDRAAEIAVQSPYYNPRPIEKAAIRDLLDHAYHGRRPS